MPSRAGSSGVPLLIRRATPQSDGAPPSETARFIGRRIVREAVWHGRRCTWIGSRQTREGRHAYGALDGNLYAGTSGVAVFLAELYAAFQEPEVGRTARGAIRQALSAADRRSGPDGLGLYDGWSGVAVAAARVGGRLGEDEFLDQAQELLRRLAGAALVDSPGFDLTQGRAGAIIAFLALHAETGDSWFLDAATRLGNDLLATAEQSDGAWSWRVPDGAYRANLTGLSHGTAGVALALSELAFASGERRFLDAGAGALRYERGWFDHDARNWRDLRDEPRGAKQGSGPKRFATHWCHGAPGIALSRLRIYELFEDDGLRGEAEVALSDTFRISDVTVSVFNGPAKNQIRLHTSSPTLGSAAPTVFGEVVKSDSKKYGPALLVADAPDAGADAFMITKFNATIFRSSGVSLARCKDKTLRTRRTVTYDDGSSEIVTDTQRCKRKENS